MCKDNGIRINDATDKAATSVMNMLDTNDTLCVLRLSGLLFFKKILKPKTISFFNSFNVSDNDIDVGFLKQLEDKCKRNIGK